MLTDPRQIRAVLEEARRVAKRESEGRPGTPTPGPEATRAAPGIHTPAPVAAGMARSHHPSPPVAKCRSCSAEIIWTVTGTGAAMPVNVAPTPTGNLSLRWNGERVLAVYVDAHFQGIRRVSHFATCEQADKHRKSR